MPRKSKLWITRTSEGFCATLDSYIAPNPHHRYLTEGQGHSNEAGYVGFPDLVTKVVSIPREVYEPGMIVQFDKNAQTRIGEDEKKAVKSLVAVMEASTKEIAQHKNILTGIGEMAQGVIKYAS
jgi:hypothetical protein